MNTVESDSYPVDLWSCVHFLAGPIFAFLMPFVQMFVIVVSWEVLEKYTSGLGEHENRYNRLVDVLVAVIGWGIIAGVFQGSPENWAWVDNGTFS